MKEFLPTVKMAQIDVCRRGKWVEKKSSAPILKVDVGRTSNRGGQSGVTITKYGEELRYEVENEYGVFLTSQVRISSHPYSFSTSYLNSPSFCIIVTLLWPPPLLVSTSTFGVGAQRTSVKLTFLYKVYNICQFEWFSQWAEISFMGAGVFRKFSFFSLWNELRTFWN